MKSGKDYKETLKYILPVAKKIIITSYNIPTQQGMAGVVSEKPEILNEIFEEIGFKNVQIIPDVKDAYQTLLSEEGNIVITGSLYLVSEVYRVRK
jgi:folylpolyglutamate synthase/dihydropteroate synthase